MLGGYAGYPPTAIPKSFIVAVIAGSAFVMVVGLVMERVVIRHFYSRPHEDQLLVTFGLSICFVEIVRFFFGSLSMTVPAPKMLSVITSLGFMLYPTYRLAVVGIVVIALGGLFLILYRSRIGMIVRAGIEDSVMVGSLGINVYRVFMVVFGIGAMAAGLPASSTRRLCRSRPTWGRRSGTDFRRGRHRWRWFVPWRHSRWLDRWRDHQHHLDDQPRIFLCHVVRWR